MPEILWRAFIDFEVAEAEFDRARALYARLLQRSGHVKLWIALALFELEFGGAQVQEGSEEGGAAGGGIEAARSVFSKGYVIVLLLSVEGKFPLFCSLRMLTKHTSFL